MTEVSTGRIGNRCGVGSVFEGGTGPAEKGGACQEEE